MMVKMKLTLRIYARFGNSAARDGGHCNKFRAIMRPESVWGRYRRT